MMRWFLSLLLIILLGLAPLYPQSAGVVGSGGIVGVSGVSQEPPGIPDPLVIITDSGDLDTGTEQSAYSDTLAATGGTTPYTWTLNAGSDPLPPGLSLATDGTISGTPTAAGDYPFTVRVTDAQPVFDTKLLSITIDPATPSDPLLFTYDDEADMSAFVAAGGSAVTSTGLVDGLREITKTTATDTVWVDNIDEDEVFGGREFCRLSEGSPTTNRYQELVGLDSAGNVLFQIGRESDSDLFAFTPGQTTFAGRGFFLSPITDGTCAHVRFHYRKGTGADALFEVSRDGGAAQSFPAGEATANVDRVIDRNENDGAGNFVADRYFLRSDAWEAYVPAVPGGGTPPPTGTSLTSVYGAACDGVSDDGPEIEAAFNDVDNWENRTLDFPAAKTCLVASKPSIGNESNFTINGNGSVIKAANGLTTGDGTPLISWTNIENATVNNLDGDGNRANRTPTGNIGGHTWQWNGVRDSTFRDIDLINNAGDGIRVSASNSADTATFSKNVTVIDSKFQNSFRDGISIIAGWNIRFLGNCTGNAATGTCTCQMTSSNGGNPQAGFNIEPNDVTADPAARDNVVDGCLLADNGGSGWSTSNKSANQDNTVQNSIIRNNGSVSGSTPISLGALGDVVEDNQIGIQAGCRFGLVYMRGGSSTLRAGIVQNNTITGTIPICSEGGGRHAIWYGTGNSQTDGTAQFKTNVMTSIGTAAGGDWCRSGVAGGASTTSGNTIDGNAQVPDPGCP